MMEKMTYRWLWSCLIAGSLLLLMAACSDGSEEEPQPSPSQPEEDSKLELRAVTRTAGVFSMPEANNKIQVYLTTKETNVPGSFTYNTTSGWESNLSVKEESQYYLYGYMPGSITCNEQTPAETNDYSKGINLQLTGLPAITLDDVSVLVGVQRVANRTTAEAPDTTKVTEGQYGFRTGIKGQNFVNLLMAHLYSKLKLSFKIGADYAELRSIHVKEVKLTSNYGDGSVTVSLKNGQGLETPAFPVGTEGVTGKDVTIFKSSLTVPEVVLDKALATSENSVQTLEIPAYCRPIAVVANQTYNLTLTTTYDVWDRKRNLGERTSKNKIRLSMASVKPGNENNIVLTVMPTYLYILSDNDLDNPTITVN